MKKKIITEEEYQDITIKLQKINKDLTHLNNLNKTILFHPNPNTEINPNELILYLKRKNQELKKNKMNYI